MAIQSARQMVLLAKAHERKGEMDLARRQYELILNRFPENFRAKRALSEINSAMSNSDANDPPKREIGKIFALMNNQEFSDAVRFGVQMASSFPKSALLWNLIGGAHGSLHKWAEAETDFKKAIEAEPGYPDSYNNLGNALKEQGKFQQACDVYLTAIDLDKNYAQAHYNLGVALKEQGKFEEAHEYFAQALKIDPKYVEALNNHAIMLREQGWFDEAIEKLEKAVKLRPQMVEAHCNLSATYRQKGEFDKAREWVDLALALQPSNPIALHNRGRLNSQLGKLDDALSDLKRAVELAPTAADTWASLGDAHSANSDSESALKYYRKALEIDVCLPRASDSLRRELVSQGKLNEAVEEIRSLAEKSDWSLWLVCMYFDLARGKVTEEDAKRLEELLEEENEPLKQIAARFGLYNYYKNIGEYDKSIKELMQANEITEGISKYKIEENRKDFKRIRRGFREEKPLKLDLVGQDMRPFSPIFILGMPRSGTSLTEQILSRHSDVDAAGELVILKSALLSLKLEGKPSKPADLQKLRDKYLEELGEFGGEKRYITDKLPHNFLHVGYILTSMPDAKVIHMSRDARATCWSNFEQHFRDYHGLGYSNSLSMVTEFYKMYRDLMEFWNEKFPGQIYELNYESLTENQEQETRKLLEFLDLDWEDACLSFEKSDRAVKTSSYIQVKEKMYTGSSEKWRNYEPYLSDFVQELDGY